MSQTLTTTSLPTRTAVSKPTPTKKPSPKPTPKPSIPSTKKPITPLPTTPSNTVKIGVWQLLNTTHTELLPPSNTESLFNGGPPSETVIGANGRKPVPKRSLLPGGKYRAIVKLFLRFTNQPENSSWAMATGWLIEPDLLVTAGHCAFDWSHNYGRVSCVKAYVGYTGKDAVEGKKNVQMRMGTQVAALESWLSKGATESRGDVSFVRLEKPFTGVTPIRYADTPVSGDGVGIGVVGYPGDLMKRGTGEKGALMYEMFLPTNYSLAETKSKMLQYSVDTFGGNSGSPVLRKSDSVAIGVHVLGGNPNSASVIAGKYGNSFDALKKAIRLPVKPFRWVSLPTKQAPSAPTTGKKGTKTTPAESTEAQIELEIVDQSSESTPDAAEQQVQPELETFLKALAKAKKVTVDPLGAIAAYGLHVAGMQGRQLRAELEQEQTNVDDGEFDEGEVAGDETAEDEAAEDEEGSETANEAEDEAFDETNENEDEADTDETEVEEAADAAFEGVAERAMLTEAAFMTFLQLKPEKCKKLGYLTKVSAYVNKHSQTCGRAGTVVFPSLMGQALRATMTKIKQESETTDTEAKVDPNDPVTVEDGTSAGFGPRLDANKESIIEELTNTSDDSGSEAFSGNVSDIISKGLRIPGPIVANVAERDLSDLVQRAESAQEFETNFEAAVEDENSSEYLYDAMAQRALIGEAMLEAILSTPAEVQREEGIFGWVKKAVKLVGKVMANDQEEMFGIGTWFRIAKAAFKVGKVIYNATKKELGDNDEDLHDEAGEESEVGDGDDWDSFISRQTGKAVAA